MNWNTIKNIGIVNTIRMNVFYFGFKSIFAPPILASRNLKIKKLSGKCFVDTHKIAAVKIGFGIIGIVDKKYRRSLWENSGCIYFKGTCNLGPGVKISCGKDAKICFGNGCNLNADTDVVCKKNITFGDKVVVSWECLFMDSDFHRIYDSSNKYSNEDRDIVIGNHVWIACRSTILKGSKIPNNCVIAARSLITGVLKNENCIYTTDKIIKENIHWE